MKMLMLNGSNNANSHTKQLLKDIHREINRIDLNLLNEYEIVNLNDYDISYCIGCRNCFKFGSCVFNDDYDKIREKILKNDVILFASPVYYHAVTGKFKSFIDRSSLYAHLLGFAGKLSFTITSSFSNGEDQVSEYLSKFANYSGTKNLMNFRYNQLYDDHSEFVKRSARNIVKSIKNNYTFTNRFLEELYAMSINVKRIYDGDDCINKYECNYWENVRNLGVDSYQRYIKWLKGE